LIEARHLPDYLQTRPLELQKTPSELRREPPQAETGEAERLLSVLRKHGWHRSKAAKELGIDRTTLWRKMKKYHLSPS
jgi:transcriptional regulator of acetoin/glycerol metabolism